MIEKLKLGLAATAFLLAVAAFCAGMRVMLEQWQGALFLGAIFLIAGMAFAFWSAKS